MEHAHDTVSPMEVPVKITFERKFGASTIRRLRLSQPTLEGVRRAVGQWVPDESLGLEYVDDEGDHVAMDTEEEWAECLRQWKAGGGDGAVRLRATRTVRRHHGPGAAPPGERPMRGWGRCWWGKGPGGCMRRRQQQQTADALGRMEVVHEVLDRLYGKGALERLVNGKLQEAEAGCADWAKMLGGTDLDVDIGRLSHRLHEWGMAALEAADHATAAEWFRLEGKLFPENPVPSYNLACALSLLGEGDQAFDALDEAVRRGYRRVAHLRSDPDLEPLRGHPRWEGLVAKVLGGQSRGEGEGQRAREGELRRCAGCSFAVTGVAPQHCCRRCAKFPGEHGGRCDRIPCGGASQEQQPQSPPKVTLAEACGVEKKAVVTTEKGTKCAGCSFAVTGLAPQHCCRRCAKKPGEHGPRCRRETAADVEEATRKKEEESGSSSSESEPEGPVRCAGEGCGFVVTRPGATHCCRRCAKGVVGHGWRCERKAAAAAAADEGAAGSEGATFGTCDGCNFLVTKPGARHCCRRCHRTPGKHGKKCQRVADTTDVAVEREAAVAAEETTNVTTSPVPAEKAAEKEEEEVKYRAELACLRGMGFAGDDDSILAVLQSVGGDVPTAVHTLLSTL